MRKVKWSPNLEFLCLESAVNKRRGTLSMTYGPMSDGVSDGGGGRLIKVGVGMIAKLATGPDGAF